MKALPRTNRQLPLGLDPTPVAADSITLTIPTAIEADVIDALATLLLEAAGISGTADGGADESEDHA